MGKGRDGARQAWGQVRVWEVACSGVEGWAQRRKVLGRKGACGWGNGPWSEVGLGEVGFVGVPEPSLSPYNVS